MEKFSYNELYKRWNYKNNKTKILNNEFINRLLDSR